ncbi:DNA cross-link repair protein pso2/snm1 [Mycena rebaudengoi]|nr:DNA cross-link repair protein pso2/snm1 [Mycena rebaudengoi]
MASSKKTKKSKDASKSSVTLHNFFASPSTKSKPVVKTPKKPTANTKGKAPISNEIIVIDSDSDVEVLPTAQKKRRRSESSSDIELVETPARRGNGGKAPVKERKLSFGKPSSILTRPLGTPEPSVPTISFGLPSALLGGPRKETDAPAPLTFSKPSSLLGEPRSVSDDDCLAPPQGPDVSDGEIDWGMGDDEMVSNPEDEEDSEPAEDISPCPLCQTALGPLSELPLLSLQIPQMRTAQSNAFSVLMTSRTEIAVWNEATTAEASRATKNNRRKAPFYKVLQGMPIAVDAFRYGCIPGVNAYFLTHAHSDHYTNLSSSWKHGPIYCSEGTANLIIHMLSVDKKWVNPLPMDVSTPIPNTGGVHVTLIEANHCPGSCLFLFEGPQTVNAGDSAFKSPFVGSPKTFRYLHCGDFRASPQHTLHPAVKGKLIDHVYLDTTYLDPKYSFPPQPLVIAACAELAKRVAAGKTHDSAAPRMDSWVTSAPSDPKGKQKAQPERILMVVGTYSVGKERIVKAIAQALQSKIYCDSRKAAILRCQPDPELHAMLTSDPLCADVHILPLGMISFEKLQIYLERFKGKFTKVVGFRPTGWTFSPPAGAVQSPNLRLLISNAQQKSFTYANLRPARSTSAALQLFPVPYSEHSSFFELTCFALSLQWGRMIATVNVGSEGSRAKMGAWVKKWEAEKKKRSKDEMVPHRRPDYW